MIESKSSKNTSIIDFILAEQEKSKGEIQKQITDNKTSLDDQTFFLDNASEGVMTKEQFRDLLQGISKNELQAFKTFLGVVSDNRKFNTSSFAHTDKKGQEYYWLKIYGKNGATEFKLSNFPGLDRFMQGYLFNLYNVNLTLEGLYQEANK